MQSKTEISDAKFRKLLYLSGLIIIVGGFLSFIFLSLTDSYTKALSIGFFYAVLLVIIINLVKKSVISKLKVFNPFQQWVLRTFIYTITVSSVYLTGLLFQSFLLTPDISLTQILSESFWSGFVTFISSPLDLQFADNFVREEFRTILIPFFAVIILIGLVSVLGSYVEMHWQSARQQQALDKAELSALKSQIEPHFIFNALNSIASQIKSDPDKAEDLILKLSDTLRYLFESTNQEMVTLESEVNFLKKYTALMQARFGTKLVINWKESVTDHKFRIPVLILQPLIENALRHGWRSDGSPLNISIRILENNQYVRFHVDDNGCGIHPQRMRTLPLKGHALANVADRLNLAYKQNDLLQIDSVPNKGTEIIINIPKA